VAAVAGDNTKALLHIEIAMSLDSALTVAITAT